MHDQGNRKHCHPDGQSYTEGTGYYDEARSQEHLYATRYAGTWAGKTQSSTSYAHSPTNEPRTDRSTSSASYGYSGHQQYPYGGFQQDYAEYQKWQPVSRPWGVGDPETVLQKQDGIHSSRTGDSQGHAHAYGIGHHPDMPQRHEQSSKSPAPQLTASRLKYLEQHTSEDEHTASSGLKRWLKSDQREGPFDGVRKVRRQDGVEGSSWQ